MTTIEIMDNEADQLIDYLTSCAQGIMAILGPTLQEIMKRWDCTSDYDLQSILLDSIERFYFRYCSPPSETALNIYLNYGECEADPSIIDDSCLDDWAIIGNYAYYSTYGFIVELNANKLYKALKEFTEA